MRAWGLVGVVLGLGCAGLLPEPVVVFANPTDAPITLNAADRTRTVPAGTLASIGLDVDPSTPARDP